MYSYELKQLVGISNKAGNRVDYVQAGGGNTSVKFGNGYMAIKASGYLLANMTENSGFVVINSDKMKEYHQREHDAGCDCNKEAMEIALSTVIKVNKEKAARPSVEVGFHSILGKYVLHLHPVYANVLLCSKGGVEMAEQIAKKAGLSCISIPYTMPGYQLTKLILNALEDYRRENSAIPEIIFLKNHGVITHGYAASKAEELMDKINRAIIDELKLPEFPTPCMEKFGDGYKSTNEWMRKALQEGNIAAELCSSPVYPDQLVYTANELSMGSDHGKIAVIDSEIYYKTNEKEARGLEETMTALVYLYHCIKEKGLELELLSEAECASILGWDSEKFRKSLMASQGI